MNNSTKLILIEEYAGTALQQRTKATVVNEALVLTQLCTVVKIKLAYSYS